MPRDDHITHEAAIPREHYTEDGYDSLGRFVSYWHQIDEVRRSEARSVLEIGVGNGFVSNYLRDRGFDVVTLDVNAQLSPDVVGSITAIPFRDASFDVVTACEVLEHLPQECVAEALREMRRVARTGAVVSVPNRRVVYPVQLTIPRVGVRRWLLRRHVTPSRHLCRDHRWEIGDGRVSVAQVRQWIAAAGFILDRDYRPFENTLHHFFVLRGDT